MSMTMEIKCDCGCGVVSDSPNGWFVLSQNKPARSRDDAKIKDNMHFYSIECINRWGAKAVSVIPILKKAARNLWPRSNIGDDLTGLHI